MESNFYSISVKIFTIRTSKTGPVIVPLGTAAETWVFRKDRELEYSRHRGVKVSTWSKSCCLQEDWLVPFLLLSNRIYGINSLLLRKHVHRISVEVNGTFTFPLLQDSHKMTSFFESLHHVVGCRIPSYHFSSDPGPKNVQCLCENFIT